MYFCAPVIAAGARGTLDVVRHGETGLLVPFGDSVAVKDAIEQIEASPDLRRRLRDAGHATVVNGGVFTFSRFAERCADVLALRDAAA
jgi:glycosyltransferase involved in cell wall biosynthesis